MSPILAGVLKQVGIRLAVLAITEVVSEVANDRKKKKKQKKKRRRKK